MEIDHMPLKQQFHILTNTYFVMMSFEILFTCSISMIFLIIFRKNECRCNLIMAKCNYTKDLQYYNLFERCKNSKILLFFPM